MQLFRSPKYQFIRIRLLWMALANRSGAKARCIKFNEQLGVLIVKQILSFILYLILTEIEPFFNPENIFRPSFYYGKRL